MKSNYFKNIAGTVIMAFSLILGISSIAAAQSWDPYQNDRYRRQQQQDQLRRQQAEQLRRDQQDQWGRDQSGRRGRGRSGDGYPTWGSNYELRQTALNAGYNEGAKQGRNDRNRNRGYGSDFRNNSSYRNATKDYNSRFGDRELYRRYFQMAFENGYADGLRGY
jgi:type II secretory pathway pseudopilin PulG